MKTTTLHAAIAAMFVTSTAMAAVNNLESYHFRYDFSKGNNSFIRSAEVASGNIVPDIVGSSVAAVGGPNGAGSAVHITSEAWKEFGNQSILNADWTLAMCFRPGTQEGGTIVSLGRMPTGGSSAVAICSSSDTNKLYVTVVTRNSSYALEKKNELTGLGDVTDGFHTLVVAYKYAKGNKGTLYFYWDGVAKGSYQLTSGYPFGSASSISGMQFHKLITRGATAVGGFTHKGVSDDSSYAFYDVRLYPGQFSADDATAYAALYPADRMGSPFRPSAYIETSATNTTANATVGNYIDTGYLAKGATTRFVADFQFLDVRGQQRIFGTYGDFVQGLYINGSAASGGKLAWNFMGTKKWVSMDVGAGRLRRIATFDRVGKTIAVTNFTDRTQFYLNNSLAELLADTPNANSNTYLFAENISGAKNYGKARIYSFEADESGTPVLFLAPDTENGEAGFRNIIDNTFYGDANKNNNPERTLRFYNGVGCASDYKYENDTLYAKLYATSDGNGAVSVADGAAASSAEGWIPHGGTLALTAVPDAEYYGIDRWEGDTWAIASGTTTSSDITVQSDTAIQLRAVFKTLNVPTPTLGEGMSVVFSNSTTFALSCALEGARLYYTLDGTTPTTSSTLYEGSFPFTPTTTKTTLKVFAVKENWLDSDMYEIVLVNLAEVVPLSAYAQLGAADLLLHLDAIENAGVGAHETSPSTWADLAGSHTVTETGSAGFQGDTWTADGSSCFTLSSDAVLNALSNKTFTLELVISHPSTQNPYENWAFLGSGYDHRNLVVDMRTPNSKNPVVQGIQYRATNYVSAAKVANGTKTAWGKRQYIAVVCDGNTATTYCAATNQLHSISGTADPSGNQISIGASFDCANLLTNGAEICAVRMTGRVLSEDERMHNFYVDSQRFGLENAPDGYRIANGKVQVLVSEGVEGFEFSTDGGETWTSGEVWADIGSAVTLKARYVDDPTLSVSFSGLPDGAVVSEPDNSATFTPTKPSAIVGSVVQWTNTDRTGSFDSAANWVGGVIPSPGVNFVVNISDDTVISVNETYSLGIMSVKGTGNVTFIGTGGIGATMLNVTSGLTVDTSGRLVVSGFAGEGNVVLRPISGNIDISEASTLTGDLTVETDSSVAFNVNADTSVSNLYVNAATDAVVTMTVGSDGSFIATSEVVVQHGVLKQGGDNVLGKTPKVTVQDGGTFDANGKSLGDDEIKDGEVVTKFHIAGAGAGSYPWALTSSAGMTNKKIFCMLYLDADATIGGANALWLGVCSGAVWNPDNTNVNLDGHKLTKTGSGSLNIRRPYSGPGGGTLTIDEGTCTFTTWGSASDAYGKSCVSNLNLVAASGVTVVNNSEKPMSFYFESIEWNGGTVTTTAQSGADGLGVYESLAGHGTTAKFCFADGATATLDGNLTITNAFIADGALSLTRKAGVETNVTVAATGTLTATNAIYVGAGVIFDIGTNRTEGTFTVADDAMLSLRQGSIDEEEIVLNASAPIQQQNIVLYGINGLELQNPEVSYDGDAGTVTVRAPTPVWSNADGTGSFSAVENWSSGGVPGEGRSFKISLGGDTTVRLDYEYVFGSVKVEGTGSVGFGGEGSLSLVKVLLTNDVSFATCGRVTVSGLDLLTGTSATLTTLDGIAEGGVTGAGTLALVPGEAESVTINCLSAFTGDFSVTPDHSMTGTLTCAATKLNKFIVNGAVNAVFTLVNGTGGSFKASEAVVAGGVLKLGDDNVLGKTPKVTVNDGGTFDVNGKLVGDDEAVEGNVVTEFHIAGAGAGNYPWALTSSANMTRTQNVIKLYLDADATIGGANTLWLGVRYGAGWSSANKNMNLGGRTLTKIGSGNLNIRRPYSGTGGGTLAIVEGTCTFSAWSNGTDAYGKSCVSNIDLVVAPEAKVVNNNSEKSMLFYFNSIALNGSTVDNTNAQSAAEGFGVLKTLSGHGMIAKLTMDAGAVFKPDGLGYLNVTNSLSGKVKVDISDPALAGKLKIPLLKVPISLKDTAYEAFDLTNVPHSWPLKSKERDGNVEYYLQHAEFSIIIR